MTLDLDQDYFVPSPGGSPRFESTTLILPQPSLGSLPQLAADLYIHTLALELVGYVALRDTVPCVGGIDSVDDNPATTRQGFSMAVEVYQDRQRTLTVVLPRAPIIQARKAQHLDSMKRWIKNSEFEQVLIVSGVDAAMRGDDSLREPNPFRHIILSSASSASQSPLFRALSAIPAYSPASTSKIAAIPHGGLTRALLKSLDQGFSIPVGALLVYTSEGDNEQASRALADALDRLLGGSEAGREWKAPKSWKAGLMGEELDRDRIGEMFG